MNTEKKSKAGLIISSGTTVAGLILTAAGYATNSGKEITNDNKLVIFGLILLLLGITALISNLFAMYGKTSVLTNAARNERIRFLALAALFAALSYIGFQFFRIDIPVGPEKTAFHFGNTFCVLAALLLGGTWGGLAGAVGMTLADLTSGYVTSAPKTFFLKLCIGLIVGLVAHTISRLSTEKDNKKVTRIAIAASICGMAFNVIADPVVGYFYKMYLLGIPQDLSAALAKISTVTTAVNAITSVITASLIYIALRPALKKSGLFTVIGKART